MEESALRTMVIQIYLRYDLSSPLSEDRARTEYFLVIVELISLTNR